MIKFICNRSLYANADEIIIMDYRELLSEECYFCIVIGDLIFFEDPLFPIREFLKYYIEWNKESDFNYISIESVENPIISFVKFKEGWLIDSVWKKFECTRVFTLSELCNAIEQSCL